MPAIELNHAPGGTVKRSELRTLLMVAGNEQKYGIVIDGRVVKEWVGFGWISLRKPSKDDISRYPKVIE